MMCPSAKRRVRIVCVGPTFVRILVEASKRVYLVIANVGDGRINEAGRLGTDCRDHLWFVALHGGPAASDRARRHEKGVAA